MKRKIILNLAISLDGYIAEKDGGFDWIKGDGNKSNDTKKQFNFSEFLETIDVVIMGKKAYEDSYEISKEMLENKKVYVASHEKLSVEKNIELIDGDIVNQVLKLKNKDGKNIWLFGGGGLTDPFIKADVIDEYIIGIIPVILGEGIPLFLENNPRLELRLCECTVQEGVSILRYSVRDK